MPPLERREEHPLQVLRGDKYVPLGERLDELEGCIDRLQRDNTVLKIMVAVNVAANFPGAANFIEKIHLPLALAGRLVRII